MHEPVLEYVARQAAAHGPFSSVIEIGGRDVNGTVRPLFGEASYCSIDLYDGPGVDIVGDALAWRPPNPVGCVVCTEVLEHAPDPERLVARAASWLQPGGVLILTMATDPRAPHAAIDEQPIRPGEHYRNIDPAELRTWLEQAGLRADLEVHEDRGDLYAVAVDVGR